jgi:hypothetical protein
MQHWALNGDAVATQIARDPWASKVARVQRTALLTGGNRTQYRAIWTAFASDGAELGTYDAWLQGYWLLGMDLYSPNSAVRPKPLTPFCIEPGDIEKWNADHAKREADKAARSKLR